VLILMRVLRLDGGVRVLDHSGQLFCASTVSQTVSSLTSAPLSDPRTRCHCPRTPRWKPSCRIPIAAMSLRFTPSSSGCHNPPAHRVTYAEYCPWGWDLDQWCRPVRELGLDLEGVKGV